MHVDALANYLAAIFLQGTAWGHYWTFMEIDLNVNIGIKRTLITPSSDEVTTRKSGKNLKIAIFWGFYKGIRSWALNAIAHSN